MGRTLAVLMSGEPVESISWEEEWRQSSGRRGMPQCPPPPLQGTQYPAREGNSFRNIRLPSSAPAQPQHHAGSGSTSS